MEQPGIQLIVGLANPGPDYARTRHNAGSWLVEGVAESAGCTFKAAPKLFGQQAVATVHGHKIHLFIPSTFMNHSGRAVRAVCAYYNIPPEGLLIVHDEIDLPAGIVRLKLGGGDGGHNGLKDIIGQLATRDFYRLRIGVGRPATSQEVVDYVLNSPSRAELKEITTGIDAALQVMPELVAGKFQAAMQKLHS